MLNKCHFMGRLTAAPVMRYTGNNTPVCSFSIACERDFKNEDGSREVDFIDFVAWRGTAEFVHKYFSKGDISILKREQWPLSPGVFRNGTIPTRTAGIASPPSSLLKMFTLARAKTQEAREARTTTKYCSRPLLRSWKTTARRQIFRSRR